jgi:hypothetical protein
MVQNDDFQNTVNQQGIITDFAINLISLTPAVTKTVCGHRIPHNLFRIQLLIAIANLIPANVLVAAMPVQPFFTLLARKHNTMEKK